MTLSLALQGINKNPMGHFCRLFNCTPTSTVGDVTSWYVSGGAHFDKLSPYITYAEYHNDSGSFFNGDENNLGNLDLGSTVNKISTAILQKKALNQNTITLGIRYDFVMNLALKAQWDHIQTSTEGGVAGTGGGMFIRPQNGFGNSPTQVDLFSVSLDFVF